MVRNKLYQSGYLLLFIISHQITYIKQSYERSR